MGSRGTETGKELWEKIKDKTIIQAMTDHWKAYKEFVPNEKHIQSKAKTDTVEGYNSLFRHFLARLRRKTQCYTKNTEALIIFLKLLMLKWNKQLDILNY